MTVNVHVISLHDRGLSSVFFQDFYLCCEFCELGSAMCR